MCLDGRRSLDDNDIVPFLENNNRLGEGFYINMMR